MALYRKLGRPGDQRKAILRTLVSALIWNGKIETTEARAKEVRGIAERLITLALKEYNNTVMVTKEHNNEKGQSVSMEVKNDSPSKLHARRQIMSYLYDLKEIRKKDENSKTYLERTKDIKHPIMEKLFGEIAPKYDKRRETNNGQSGGYTHIIKKGPRRGDAAEVVILELV